MAKRSELYLRCRANALPAMSELEALLREARPAALLITGAAGEIETERLESFVLAARRQSLAVLIENDAALARKLGAEGVHLHMGGNTLIEARRILGEEKSIGVACALSRDDAMSMAEQGADYVAFGAAGRQAGSNSAALIEMVGWWSELIETPCVAWIWDDDTEEHIGALIDAGADFLAVDAVSGEAAAPMARIRRVASLARGAAGQI